jgi:hypothetical protein
MKAGTISHLFLILFILFFLFPGPVLSQQEVQAPDSSILEPSPKYNREELAQMLAPIALYPDALLSQVLMASTYPIEIIMADRWIKKNPELMGDALDNALLTKEWDPSVKAICHFPAILALMSERIGETTNIGNAFLAQEDEVMNMVQELRAKAYAQGNLTTNAEQKITVEKETIIIEPANPQVLYVPYYDPYYVYGAWWYPAYPPYYWGPSRVGLGVGISYWPGFYFGFAFGSWSYFDWHNHYIYIDGHKQPRYVRRDRWGVTPGPWHHTPIHRRGVAYRDKPTALKYGQYPSGTRRFRPDTRGFPSGFPRSREQTRHLDSRGGTDQHRFGGNARTGTISPPPIHQRVESLPQTRRQSEPGRQERQRVESTLQNQQRAEYSRQRQQPASNSSQPGPRMQRDQQQRSRDNVFNRVNNGRMERESSQRGQYSRQRQWNDFHGGGHSGSSNRGGSYNRSHNRR